jgi:3-hydroxy-9,10-secoandrosta-1,3,5(10)-triene-9,17-dione monooxygenase reductase component
VSDWQLDCAWMLDRLVTSCCVITASVGDTANGCLVASVMPVGINDRLVAFSQGRHSLTQRLALRSGHVALHLLGAEDVEIARRFGRASADGGPKFRGLEWHRGVTGSPIIRTGLGVIEARIVRSVEIRDHVVHVAEAVHAVTYDCRQVPFSIVHARQSDLEAPRVAVEGSQGG